MEDFSLATTSSDGISSDAPDSAAIGCALAQTLAEGPEAPEAARAGKTAQDPLSGFRSKGGQDCFEDLVRRYGAMVLHVCRQVTRDRHDAEDATQVAFLILAERLRAGETIHSLGAWLQQVGRRTAIDIKRSRTRRSKRERKRAADDFQRTGVSVNPPGAEGGLDDDLARIIRDELDRVPAKYRIPLVLHYFGGLPHADMARELGIKAPTLNVRLFRGRKMLAERLARRGGTPGAPPLGVRPGRGGRRGP